MNRNLFAFALLLGTLMHFRSGAQERVFSTKIESQHLKILLTTEDSLRQLAEYLYTDDTPSGRMFADSLFTKTLVRALKVPHSFGFSFEAVKGVTFRYAPDSSFRIITWNLQYDNFFCRQKGAIQKQTENGSLSLYPLQDISEFTARPQDSLRSARQWIGAIYYNIILTQHQGKNFYTLFGFDSNNTSSTIKWLDVLQFDSTGAPRFGGPFFTFDTDPTPTGPKHRICLEYKKGVRVLMDYIAELDMILIDHLISETEEPEKKYTYVPDGDQEGFKWDKGKWVHIDKVFTQKLEDGQAPREMPLFDKSKSGKPPTPSSDKGKGKNQ